MRDGLIVWCPYTNPVPGRIHDIRVAREITGVVTELEEWELMVCDKGYQGLDNAVVPIRGSWAPEHLEFNGWLYSIRSLIERSIGRIKTFKCLTEKWRHDLYYHPCAFQVCAQLANLTIRAHPLIQHDHSLIDI
jgi:hypothetical protein